jgi:DNA-binding MarR family transcriptional regulator
MTRHGRRLVEDLRPHMHRAERHLVEDLSAEERTTLLDLLARMQRAATTLRF